MAIQYINTGSSANAGNGDSIRLAFTKVNNNFAEVTDRINSTTYVVDNGIFQGISVAATATIVNLTVTGLSSLTNVTIAGLVSGPVVFDSTGTFDNLIVLNTATIRQLSTDDLSVANTSTLNDIVVSGQVLGDLNVTNSGTFASLNVANTTTLNDLTINGELTIGTYQGFDDFNIIKDDINGLNFRLRNIHADSFTQINLLDNIDGGLYFVHQNSTGDSGNFSAGQNYIYGVIPTDTLNIGKYSDINFFANIDKYYTPSVDSIPSIAITAVDGKVTIAKDLYVTSSTFFLGGKAVAVTPSNGLTIDGNPITGGGTSDRLTNGVHAVVLDSDGTLNVNNSNFPSITGADGVKISTTDGKELMLDWVAAAVNPYPGIPQLSTSVGAVSLGYGGVTIEVNNANGGGYWTFAPTGALTHSVGSATKTVNNNLISGVATQVVWTSTYENISGAKLTIQVECGEGGSGNWDTQVCEAIVAVKGYNLTSEPQMVVYGVIHTSVAPLMTFTIQRNPTTSFIEIVGTRTLTANPLGNASLTICSVETRTND